MCRPLHARCLWHTIALPDTVEVGQLLLVVCPADGHTAVMPMDCYGMFGTHCFRRQVLAVNARLIVVDDQVLSPPVSVRARRSGTVIATDTGTFVRAAERTRVPVQSRRVLPQRLSQNSTPAPNIRPAS